MRVQDLGIVAPALQPKLACCKLALIIILGMLFVSLVSGALGFLYYKGMVSMNA